jgi:hypothetical protein
VNQDPAASRATKDLPVKTAAMVKKAQEVIRGTGRIDQI